MGRVTSLTLEMVAGAMRDLAAVGRYPSMAAVRERLGTGSAGTLLRLMREARESGEFGLGVVVADPAVVPSTSPTPVPLPADLADAIDAVQRAYARAVAAVERAAEERVTAAQQQAREEINRAHTATQAVRRDLTVTETELEDVAARLEAAETELSAKEGEVFVLSGENIGLKRALLVAQPVAGRDGGVASPPPGGTSNG